MTGKNRIKIKYRKLKDGAVADEYRKNGKWTLVEDGIVEVDQAGDVHWYAKGTSGYEKNLDLKILSNIKHMRNKKEFLTYKEALKKADWAWKSDKYPEIYHYKIKEKHYLVKNKRLIIDSADYADWIDDEHYFYGEGDRGFFMKNDDIIVSGCFRTLKNMIRNSIPDCINYAKYVA